MKDMDKINKPELKDVSGGAQMAGKNVCLNCKKTISAETAAQYDGCCSEKCRNIFWQSPL